MSVLSPCQEFEIELEGSQTLRLLCYEKSCSKSRQKEDGEPVDRILAKGQVKVGTRPAPSGVGGRRRRGEEQGGAEADQTEGEKEAGQAGSSHAPQVSSLLKCCQEHQRLPGVAAVAMAMVPREMWRRGVAAD